MPFRLSPPQSPVTIEHDGEPVLAERGEPLAAALVANGRLAIARSPKLHRPRGPYCFRGGCDGCLARVNGEPNIMTCLWPTMGGEVVETQNVLGSRELDLLRATDFLFPHGIDHHRLFAGVRGVSGLVQTMARRIAGLGRLPSAARLPTSGSIVDAEFLIVGGGASGLAAAKELGARVVLADDALELGGNLRALDPARADALVQQARAAGAQLLTRTTAAALSREPEGATGRPHMLLVGPSGARVVRSECVILACGRHQPVLAFDNNDLPGVFPVFTALRLLAYGVAVGRRVALIGSGVAADVFESRCQTVARIVRLPVSNLIAAKGRARVTAVRVRDGERERELAVDAIVIAAPGAPALELVGQAGGTVVFDFERGYLPVLNEALEAAPRVFCAGGITGLDGISADQGASLGSRLSAG